MQEDAQPEVAIESVWLRSGQHPLAALCVAIFLAALLLFVLTASGHIQTIDVNQSKAVSQQMVAHGQVAITGFPTTPAGGTVIGTGGHAYAEHDIGLAIIFVPISAMLQWHWISPANAEFLYA
jgi:Na+/proline symporter